MIILILTCQTVSSSQEEQWRAFWVVRDALLSEQSITTMVDRVADSNCNMVFVQVCGRGDAYYVSDMLPRAEALSASESSFDPLQTVVHLAHERGLEIHAWVNTFFVWSAVEEPLDTHHVFHSRHEWIEHTMEGRPLSEYERPRPFGSDGIYLAPGCPAVKVWIADIVSEIVGRYDIDGIHLDYVRYPNDGTGFHPEALLRFQDQHQFHPVSLFRGEGDREGDSADESVDSLKHVWIRWRCEQVTETVRMIRDRIQGREPGVKLSAAVKPDYDRAVEKYGQDWKRWMEMDLLDFVVAMAYSPSTDRVLQQIQEVRDILRDRSFFAGIGIYNQSISATIQQIKAVRSVGVDGLSLFSYNSIAEDDDYFTHLKESCFIQASLKKLKNATTED